MEDSGRNPNPFLDSRAAAPYSSTIAINTSLTAPEFIDAAPAGRLFGTGRRSAEVIVYRIPALKGSYEVTLLFAEDRCSQSCQDLADPAGSAGSCRVFDVIINGEIVADQFAPYVEASRALGRALPSSSFGAALAKKTLQFCGDVRIDGPFRRGDSNADGAVDVSDAISLLEFLFAGRGDLVCMDASDANDDGVPDITDAIFALEYLFLGTSAIPAPGPNGCGRDPTPDALEFCAYPQKRCDP